MERQDDLTEHAEGAMYCEEELVVTARREGDIGIIAADGVVDLATMKPMREAVRGMIADGIKHVVLDLRQVGYMDSAGISIIMTAKRGVSDRHGSVCVVTQPGDVKRALDLVQLHRVVHMADSPEAAMTHLGSGCAVPA